MTPMELLKCSNCGCIGLPYGDGCKRCRQPLTIQTSRSSHSSLINRLPDTIKLLAIGPILIGIIAAFVVGGAQLKKYFDPTPTYLEAIRKSGKFDEPITLRVSQKPIPISRLSMARPFGTTTTTVLVTKTATLLQALGFLTIRKTTSSATTQLGNIGLAIDTQSERIEISLTEKGQEEALDWRTTEEPYPGALEKALWWHVPIGLREITRIEVTNETMLPNMVEVAVHWRWHPNKLGEAFDCGGSSVGSLPKKSQDFAQALGWNSQIEYTAQVRLRRVGEVWQVAWADFPEDRKGNEFKYGEPADELEL